MKLTVNLTDGRTLVYEGTFDELVRVGEECVAKFGNFIASPTETAQMQPSPVTTVKVGNGAQSRRWTEQTARRLWGILYGDQAKLVKYLVQCGGKTEYKDLGKHMGYKAQRLSGVLSSITRNAQAATGDRLARLVDWRNVDNFKREYYIDPEALPLMSAAIQHQP